MIIGRGFLAKAFKKNFSRNKKIIIFASGVSNSKEKNQLKFRREVKLLKKIILCKDKTLVYFSTCSVNSTVNNPYILHKKNIEKLIKKNFKRYYIFRLPQVVGETYNLNLFINNFYYNIRKGISFNLWKNSKRNLIDIRDVVKIASFFIINCLRTNRITVIAAPFNLKVISVIKVLEEIISKKAKYKKVANNLSKIRVGKLYYLKFKEKLKINFNKDYYVKILYKYYKNRILSKFYY